MNTSPYISVITINRNNAKGLLQTLESVWNDQKYGSVEQIVIDGASTDDSVEMIKRFEDKLAYWVSEPDSGIYNAMNKGIAHAKGEYLLFLNSGDWLVADILEKILVSPFTADIVYGDRYDYYDSDRIVLHRYDEPVSMLYLFRDVIPHQSAFIHRSLFADYGYNEENKIVSDCEFFIRKVVFEQAVTAYVPHAISYFNMNGISSDEKFSKLQKEEFRKCVRDLLPPKIYDDYVLLNKYNEVLKWAGMMDIMPLLENRGSLSRKVGRAARMVIWFNNLEHKILSLFKRKKG